MVPTALVTYLFVGLGNPGDRYAMTRHNFGRLVIERVATKFGWSIKEDRHFQALTAKGEYEGRQVHLLLPMTYMNLSGQAVRKYLDYYKLPIEGVVVVTDDTALSFGQMRLKPSGSSGGHNGLKHIEACLGTPVYGRLRLGVGHQGERDLADYVLENFNQDEQKELGSLIDRGADVLLRLIRSGFQRTMNLVNMTEVRKVEPNLPDKQEQIDLTKPQLGGQENRL